MRAFANILDQRLKLIMTKDVNKITRLMGLTIMQVSKNFKSKKAHEDFRKIEWYFEDFCEVHESTRDERILGECEELSIGAFRWQRTARQ